MKRYVFVQANVVKQQDNGYKLSYGVPSFILDRYVQGITTEDHAIRVAKAIINHHNDPTLTVHVSTDWNDNDDDRCEHGMFYTGAGACPACTNKEQE